MLVLKHFPDHTAWAFVREDVDAETASGTCGVVVPADAGMDLLHDKRADAVADGVSAGFLTAGDGRTYKFREAGE